ncbi:hypothetical protein AB4Z16_10570 [Bosea sp. TAF32]
MPALPEKDGPIAAGREKSPSPFLHRQALIAPPLHRLAVLLLAVIRSFLIRKNYRCGSPAINQHSA